MARPMPTRVTGKRNRILDWRDAMDVDRLELQRVRQEREEAFKERCKGDGEKEAEGKIALQSVADPWRARITADCRATRSAPD